MNDETDPPEDDDGPDIDVYEPMAIVISDGDCVVPDPVEFCQLFDAIAIINRGCDLFVLGRDTLKWRKVEPAGEEKKPARFKSV